MLQPSLCAAWQRRMLSLKQGLTLVCVYVLCCAVQYCEQGGHGSSPCAVCQLPQSEPSHTAAAWSTAQNSRCMENFSMLLNSTAQHIQAHCAVQILLQLQHLLFHGHADSMQCATANDMSMPGMQASGLGKCGTTLGLLYAWLWGTYLFLSFHVWAPHPFAHFL